MPGATQLAEGATLERVHTVHSNDGPQTRLETRMPDGTPYTIVLDAGDASGVAKGMHPGDKVGSFLDRNNNVGVINETRGTVSFTDANGHYHTETREREGAVVEKHHHNSIPDDRPGARANSLILDDNHHVRLHPGKDAEAVINSVHQGDEVAVYRDEHNRPVVYNETQRTVSRPDAHGHYATEPQREQSFKGELANITRDPKNPDVAKLEVSDELGFTTTVEVHDRPGKRIDALMKPGDAVEAKYSETSPGKSDISVNDKTRHVQYDVDHNGATAVTTHPRSQTATVEGVTHSHWNGPILPTSPGTEFGGKVENITNDRGVVKVEYSDAFGKPHSIAIDGKAAGGTRDGLANATFDTLRPGDNFELKFKNDGAYQLTDYKTNTVVTPGRGNGVEITHPQQDTQAPVKAVGGRD